MRMIFSVLVALSTMLFDSAFSAQAQTPTVLSFGGFSAEARCLAGRTTFSNEWGWSASGRHRACGSVATYQFRVTPRLTVGPIAGLYTGGGSVTTVTTDWWGTQTTTWRERGSINLAVRGVWQASPRWAMYAELGAVRARAQVTVAWDDVWGTGSVRMNFGMRGAYAEIGGRYRVSERFSMTAGIRQERARGAGLTARSTVGTFGALWSF
jgi:hypothetical protein